jgi:hypothetical protein
MVAIITKTRKFGPRNKIKSCNGTITTKIWGNISLSYTFKSAYINIKACGSWSPYIGREVSSYFRPQTSKFRLYSWHFRHRNLDLKGFSHQFKSKCQISNFLMKKFKYLDLPQYLFIIVGCSTKDFCEFALTELHTPV